MTWFTLWMITINTIFWVVCCFGVAWAVYRLIPITFYKQINWFFKGHPYEKRLYKIIKIGRWKRKLPEWGKVWNFDKKHLKKELNLEYIDRFILETYRAEIGHLGMAILGFACVLVNPSDYYLMAITSSIVNCFIQIPFCLIQRYNRPRLMKIRLRYENEFIK